MTYILLLFSLGLISFGIFNIKRNLAKGIAYDLGGDLRRTFLKPRMTYGHQQKAENCNLIMPGTQTMVGIVLLIISLYQLF